MQNVQHVSRILWSVSTTVRKKKQKEQQALKARPKIDCNLLELLKIYSTCDEYTTE